MNIYKVNFAKQILIPGKEIVVIVHTICHHNQYIDRVTKNVIFTFKIVGVCVICSLCFFPRGYPKSVATKILK